MRDAEVETMPAKTTGAEITPTAKLTADLRRYSDIPFAREIADLVDADQFARGMPGGGVPADVLLWMAPLIEARYKCLSHAIEAGGVGQVLEFASGFSFRGVAMSGRTTLRYVETDLQGIHDQRQRLRRRMERDGTMPVAKNCIALAADMLSRDDVEAASRQLDPAQPLAIVNEGILPYFSAEEKDVAARHVVILLRQFGGVWLTPDFKSGNDGIERLWSTEGAQIVGRYLGSSSGKTQPRDRSLSDDGKVHAFLARHGMVGEMQVAIPDPSTLVSARRLGTSTACLDSLRSALAMWTIRLA